MLKLVLRSAFFCCLICVSNISQAKTVLITGGLSGLGREMSIAFKEDGWNVWATTRDPKKHENITGIKIAHLDITNPVSIKKLIAQIKTADGQLDVLINNAGYGILGPEEAVGADQARDLLDVNVIGPLQLIQAALPMMRDKKGGYIINISSTSGLRALPGLGMYAASKMALEGLSESLAAELAPWNIRVSIIEPGTVKNDWAKNALIASNVSNYPMYKNFTDKLRSTLIKKALEIGQNQKEIGQLALKIVKTENPDLRYQANNSVATLANEIKVDPTGNGMRAKTLAFASDLYNDDK